MKNFSKKIVLFLIYSYSIVPIFAEIQSYETVVNGMTFSIDPRIELFNIIAMQAGHHGMTLSNISYKKECLDYFTPYKKLEAPKLLFETWRKGWGVDDPMFFLLYLDHDFNLKKGLDEGIVKRGGGIAQIKKLANSFKEFAEASNFQSFFNTIQKDFYQQTLSNTKYNFKDFHGVKYLEDYYGQKCNSYTVILNINSGYGNFGKQVPTTTGVDLYAIVETNTSFGNLPTYFPTISTVDLILHEFSHGFVNPVLDQFKNELHKSKNLYKPIAKSMQFQAYRDWNVTVIEHVVRAIVTRITAQIYGEAFNKSSFYKLMIARRFIYADAIIAKLKVYEENRHFYKNFTVFGSELIKVFDSISKEYVIEKQQKVDHVRNTEILKVPKPYEFAKDSTTYFIVSTHEKNKIHEQQMRDFVATYRNMFSSEIKIITDDKALEMNLSDNDIVVFGTQEGNSFLRKYIHKIPITIKSNYILTNKVIRGNNLQLITSWVNPFNTKKIMVIYTAQKTENIKDFFYSATKDQYHYWIAQELIPIHTGNYENYSKVWMPSIF